MNIQKAKRFIRKFAPTIRNDEVCRWEWYEDDEIFGKHVAWAPCVRDGVEIISTVDLNVDQVQLVVTLRNLTEACDNETRIIFDALISFDDQTVSLDGEVIGADDTSIQEVVSLFNNCGIEA